MQCRFCKKELDHVFIDLVSAPASNSYLTREQLNEPEFFYPLKVYVCDNCFLVQVDEYKKSAAIFNQDYAYFSSYSRTWLEHAKAYTEMMIGRFGFDENSQVIEVASNDGYLLQYFKERNIPVMGVEPTANTAEVAMQKGIKTIVEFFGTELATRLREHWDVKADLLLGNNVLAHVPDIVDFVHGMKIILAERGIITMEFPHLVQLIDKNQFDTIYHEHFSYLSFYTVKQIFEEAGLVIFDVDQLPTHGGSLRIYARHAGDDAQAVTLRVDELLALEKAKGVDNPVYYSGFDERAFRIKLDLLSFLIEQKNAGKRVAAYGAAAKGNTLLNYCGIKNDLVSFVADANPHKQGKWLPASHIPVVSESHLRSGQPDYIIIFPWNLKEEIIHQLSYAREWGAKFVIPIPELAVL